MIIKSTKTFDRMPVAHAQFQDTTTGNIDFSGACSKLHGYDRSVTLEFSGTPDAHGWIMPFGELKSVRSWLHYYFDHTAIVDAHDPRLHLYQAAHDAGLIVLRTLPWGVSMEMSSLFIWQHVNAYVQHRTASRCWVSRVESREHEANAGCIAASRQEARNSYEKLLTEMPLVPIDSEDFLIRRQYWTARNLHDGSVKFD